MSYAQAASGTQNYPPPANSSQTPQQQQSSTSTNYSLASPTADKKSRWGQKNNSNGTPNGKDAVSFSFATNNQSTGRQPAPHHAFSSQSPTSSRSGRRGSRDDHGKPSTPKNGKKGNSTWPHSLVSYVERCLANSGPNKHVVESHLKDRIQGAIAAGKLNSIDWDSEPLPLVALDGDTAKGKKRKKKSRWDDESDDDESVSITFGGRKIKKQVKKQKGKRHKGMTLDDLDPDELGRRSSRANRFQDTLDNNWDDDDSYSGSNKSSMMFQKMKERAYGSQMGKVGSLLQKACDINWEDLSIVGTSEKLEKQYLRLTSAPDPANVRPLRVLKKTLAMLREKWASKRNYKYTCEQFKSMRQDLTIQHIRDEFTVEVYEQHALWALEMGDLSEFNQCQTQLMHLYELSEAHRSNVHEFTSYRLLYYVVTSNQTAMVSMLKDLDPSIRAHPVLKHAMAVRSAVLSRNYVQFFNIWNKGIFKEEFLIDKLIPHMRFEALRTIAKCYRPTKFPLASMVEMLQFDNLNECIAFCLARGAVLTPDQQVTFAFTRF